MELNNLLSGFLRKFMSKIGLGGVANYLIGQKGPVWIDTTTPYIQYNTIPQFKTVVDRKAAMFSNMQILHLKIGTDEQVGDKELMKLLENPNCDTGQNDFLKEYMTQKCVYGNQFIYANRVGTLANYPVALWNVSPRYIKPVLTGKLFDQVAMDGIISKYDYIQQGYTRSFETKDIMYTKIRDLDNPIIGISPVISLKYPLSNIELAYKFRNVIMGEKGAIGILSQDKPQNDGDGIVPMTPVERQRIEDTYVNKYGIKEDQARVVVTEASMKWQPMTYPTRDLLLFEEVDANMRTIGDALGMNQNLFSALNGSTYENAKQALIGAYQDTLQPEADALMQSLGKFLNIPAGTYLKASYEHLSILKENKLKGMQSIKTVVESLTQAIQAGLLDPIQAENILATELGISVSDKTSSAIITKLNRLSPLVANNVLQNLTIDETRALVGESPLPDGAGKKLASVPTVTPAK